MRQPKPFFRKQTQSWYVKVDGKFRPLGKDEKQAWEEYHKIMAGREPVTPTSPVANLIGAFLSWCEKQCELGRMKPLTVRWYKRFLNSFVESIGPKLKIGNLKTSDVTDWCDWRYGKNTAACKRGAVASVKRALNWAVDVAELIPVNPIKKIVLGKPQAREIYITKEQWARVIAAVDDSDPFKDLLLIFRATGCRPQEARLVECRHVDFTRNVWEFPIKESKCGEKTQRKRVVPLNDAALALTQRAFLRAGGEGRLFVNRKGRPFTTAWINSKFIRLSKKLGFKIFAYALRHTWISDALINGVDPVTVATIAGHDPVMTMKIYAHVHMNDGHMRRSLAVATGEAPPLTRTA